MSQSRYQKATKASGSISLLGWIYNSMFKRILLQTLLYPLLVGLILLIGLLFTHTGLLTIYGVTKLLLPGNLNITELKGRLIDSVQLNNIEYTSKKFSFQADSITLEGQLPALLNKTIQFPSLLIKNGTLTIPDKPNNTLQISELKLSLHYSIETQKFSIYLKNVDGTFKDVPLTGSAYARVHNQALDWIELQGSWGLHQFNLKTDSHKTVYWTWTNGTLLADGHLNLLPEGAITGDGKMVLSKNTWRIPLPGKQFYNLKSIGEITAQLNEKGLSFFLQLKEHSKNSLEGHIALPNFKLTEFWKEQPIEGSMVGTLKDLSITYLLVPAISRLKAETNLVATLKGTLAQPLLHLDAKLNNGIFSIPKQHITIKQFSAHLTGDLPGTLTLTSNGTLSDNPFTLQGTIDPLSLNHNTSFEFLGKNLRIYNTDNIQIIASPHLSLRYDDGCLKITGDVDIPLANITMRETLNHVIRSNDVRIIDKKNTMDTTPQSLYIDPNISILIDDSLHFKGHGLDAVIGGRLQIERRHDGLYTGTGRLRVRKGKYRIQGSMGHIRHGRLLFPGGTLLNNPVLDIRIAKKRERLEDSNEVGIYVQGSLLKPIFSPYSTDNLQNSEILSQLGFGSNQTEAQGGRQLFSQSAWLLNSGATPLVDQLQNKFGLEEIGIQSRNTSNSINMPGGVDSYLVVGKSLTEKLYIQFLQSMMEQSTLLLLKYYLTNNIAIGIEKGTEGMGSDLSFSVEKD
jgi:hypothetical protein